MSLVKKASTYIFFDFLVKGIGFLVLPLMSHFLTTKEFGIVALYMQISFFMAGFYNMGMLTRYSSKYFELDSDQKKLQFNLIIANNILALLFCLPFIVIGASLEVFNMQWYYWLTLPIYVLANNLFLIFQTRYNLEHQNVKYTLSNVIVNVAGYLLSILLVIFLSWGLLGRMISIILPSLLVAGFLLLDHKDGFSKISCKEVIDCRIKSSWYYFLIFPVIIENISNYFIEKNLGTASLGIYQSVISYSMIFIVFERALQSAWMPHFYEKLKNAIFPIKDFLFVCLLLIIVATLVIIAAPFYYKYMMHESFGKGATWVMYVIIAKLPLYLLAVIIHQSIFLEKKALIIYLSISSVVFAFIGNFFFTPIYGVKSTCMIAALIYTVFLMVIVFSNSVFNQKTSD